MDCDFKVIIWGLGTNGRNLIDVLDKRNIIAIIDSNKNKVKEKTYLGIPIVSLEEYKTNYNEYFIAVSPMKYLEIENLLKNEGICKYFVMAESSVKLAAFLEINNKKFIDDYKLRKDILYLINGVNLFAIYLYKYLIYNGYQVQFIALAREQCYGLDLLVEEDVIDEYCYKEVFDTKKVCLISTEKNYQQNNIDIIDCDMLNDRFYLKWKKDLKEFKNKHLGKRVFIVATGPSLRVEDLERLADYNEITISMNSIYYIFEQTKWRPNYYVVSDGLAIREYENCENREELFRGVEKIFSDNYLNFWMNDLDDSYHGFRQEQNINDIQFSDDFAQVVFSGLTVVYTCLQWAVYLGFKEIYLLGCDFNFSKNFDSPNDHFYHKVESHYTFDYNSVEKSYNKAQEYARTHGIEIYNVTRGGKLEVFQRKNFDELFDKELLNEKLNENVESGWAYE